MSEEHGEIIIIKRHKPHEEEHHGGAWKIAFADFMTAMMAFFLVLWIINATDKHTKTLIARYFNPVRLENPAKTTRGVRNADASGNAAQAEKPEPGDPNDKSADGAPERADAGRTAIDKKVAPSETAAPRATEGAARDPAAPKPTMSDAQLFKDPRASLDRIVANDAAKTSLPDDPSFKDPFQIAVLPQPGPDPSMARNGAAASSTRASPEDVQSPAAATEAPARDEDHTAPDASLLAGQAAAQLKQEIQKLPTFREGKLHPLVDVKATKDGVLISLTDQWNFSMFAVGSAEPQGEAVKAVDSIAELLKGRRGEIIVRGHTDARPYKSGVYDNWRLSSARAQMVYYMLTRAGLAETRFQRVEGYADRQLKDPAHPLDAKNRYIEILLQEPHP